MSKSLNRREFLKFLALLPPSLYLSRFLDRPFRWSAAPPNKNVLVLLCDALSAKNISLYGYRRDTMPNLARMAERGTVYHNHYAGGNFTSPGTASLLTGTYPWTNRSLRMRDTVIEEFKRRSLFSFFNQHYRFAYSHNNLVNVLLREFSEDINYLKPQLELFLKNPLALDRLFPNDADIASVAWQRAVKKGKTGYSYSLFFSSLYERLSQGRESHLSDLFPRGIPHTGQDDYFLLEQCRDWLISQIEEVSRPFLAYFHVLPPHYPYCTRREYVNVFRNNVVEPLNKPKSIFSGAGGVNLVAEGNERRRYDEFILYADAELGKIFDYLQKSGTLENTWVVFTSDHGEMFERGILRHQTPVLYEPLLRIPLLIIEPGQQKRADVYDLTSAVDVLPTLLKVMGNPIPDWIEGQVLPPFSDANTSADRSIFAVESKSTPDPKHGPLNPVTVAMVKGRYKFIYYAGYEELGMNNPSFEMYDLENDPEELDDIYKSRPGLSAELKNELLTRLNNADRPYQRG